MRSARNSAIAAVGALLLLAGGCADYMTNRNSVTLGLGNAPQANIGIHTIDPFPPEAWETDIRTDGRPVEGAQRIYRGAAATPEPAAASTTN